MEYKGKCPYIDECDAFRCKFKGGDLHPSWINPCKWRLETENKVKYRRV